MVEEQGARKPAAIRRRGGRDIPASEVDEKISAEQQVELSLSEMREHAKPSSLPQPIKNPPNLPLHHLESRVFERVIAEVIAQNRSSNVHFYGRNGQQQYGLDIYEEQEDGTRVVYQVKKYERISPRGIQAAITAYAGTPIRRGGSRQRKRRFDAQRFVLVTSAAVDDDTAKIDLIANLQAEYRGDLQIAVWGAETVSQRLRDAPALVTAVFGESWATEFCGTSHVRQAKEETENRRRIDQALRAALAAQFTRDNEIRFRQVELSGVTVESLFVDVPVSSYRGSNADLLIESISPPPRFAGHSGGGRSRSFAAIDPSESGRDRSAQSGAAQALLHPQWSESAVLVGGPGQGKTTLLQFLCQFHRARVLGRDEYSPVAAGLAPVSNVLRTPIRIELPDYAEWRAQRRKASVQPARSHARRPRNTGARTATPDVTLESYIAKIIADASTLPFSTKDLITAVTSRPMLLAFDGLDEVADAEERDEIADEIRTTSSRVKANGEDVLILIATRPGSVGRPIWRDPQFAALFLNQLTPPLRMKYLERWTAQSRLAPSEVRELERTFVESITLPHVVELAGNPMQLAILLHLMQRRTVLPEKRTALYDRYIDVFMDREAKSSLVAEHKDLIVAFHKLLAWHIHTRVELGESKGAISLGDLKELLTKYLIPRGHDIDFIDDLFQSVTTRVLCLVQRDLDSREFQFEVQPLREYFAAEHIFDMSPNNSSKNSRPACLAALLRRPYWANVMRFFAGKFAPGEVPAMIYVLREMQQDKQIGDHPISRAAAKLLLDDQVLTGQVELVIKDMVKIILDGPGATFVVDGLLQQDPSLLRFQERGGAKQAAEYLLERADSCEDPDDLESIAELLEHFAIRKQAVDRCRSKFGAAEPDKWLQKSAILHAFQHMSLGQTDELARIATSLAPNELLMPALIQSQSMTLDDQLVRQCLDEIRRGQIDVHTVVGCETPYTELASTANPWNFLGAKNLVDRPGNVPVAQAPSASPRVASRGSESRVWSTHVQAVAAAYDELRDRSNVQSWAHLFDSLSAVWTGDCWPVREALFATPDTSFSSVPGPASLAQGSPWRTIARWREAAISNRSDVEWWKNEARQCGADQMAKMTYVSAALTTASSGTVQNIAEALSELVASLDRSNFGATSGMLHHCSTMRTLRRLNLTEPLRLRQIAPSARLAILMLHVGQDSTRAQLRHFLAEDLSSLWRSGSSVSSAIQKFVLVPGQSIPLSNFKGSRRDLPEGSFRSFKMERMTYAQAQELLRAPQQWPTDLVRAAADRLGARLANQVPLSTLAAESGWQT